MRKLIKPNFRKCNLNISATLAEFLGAENKNAVLPMLRKELKKNYKNIVFICFDGLGMYPLEKNTEKDDFLRKNIVDVLRSTFPSTTTNATTSLITNKLPLEHGWFGWSMYFNNIKRNVNIFLNTDSWTNEKIDTDGISPLAEFPYYFDEAKSDYEINTLFPPFIKTAHPERNAYYQFDMEQFFDEIKKVCEKPNKQFLYAYNNEPDHSMHEYGVTSLTGKTIVRDISQRLQKIYEEERDTLFIVTADHGLVDIDGYVEMYKDEKMYSMLETYPYMEVRAIAFKVKDGFKKEFVKHFKRTYGKDFILKRTERLVKKGYFGKFGDKRDLLGDYVAIGISKKTALLTPDSMLFKGHHTSLTEEMSVPLILLGK